MKIVFILMLVMSIISCTGNNFKKTDYGDLNMEPIEDIDYVVFPYDLNNDKFIFNNGKPTELTAADIENINIILEMVVKNYNNNIKESWEKEINLKNYKKQFIPIINENGEKEIYINCFFHDKSINDYFDWKKELIFVCDGGNNYFQLKVNLKKMTYYDFMVNGYA